MSGRDPHIPIEHARSARTRVLDNSLARIGAREPLMTNDPVLQGLADLIDDIDLAIDRIAPAARSLLDPGIVLSGGDETAGPNDATVLPSDDDRKVRPHGRRRQTWSVLMTSGIAASFVAASLLSSSSPPTATPSLAAAAETKHLLTHATKILPHATASNAAHVAYARLFAADLTHAAALLPQVQDPQAHASLAEQLASLQQQVPPSVAPPPAASHPSRGRPSTSPATPGPPSGSPRAGAGAPQQSRPQSPAQSGPGAGLKPPPATAAGPGPRPQPVAGHLPPRQQSP